MSNPSDFNRLDTANRGVRTTVGRYEQFKLDVAAQVDYRKAYNELALVDPAAALTLPHPDSSDHDFAASLELLRGLKIRLKADPKMEIKA